MRRGDRIDLSFMVIIHNTKITMRNEESKKV